MSKTGYTVRIIRDVKPASITAMMLARVGLPGQQVVRVGVPDNVNHKTVKHITSKSGKVRKKSSDGGATPLSVIAAAHEFGVPSLGIPERPFLRPSIRTNKQRLVSVSRMLLKKVVRGEMTMVIALEQLGNFAVGLVKQYIRNAKFTPLKAATIRAKGSSKPLIDSGQLIQSVTYQVDGRSSNGI